MFKKVLAATARPLACDESVLSASRIAQIDKAKLIILHVLEPDSSIYRNFVKRHRTDAEIVNYKAYQDEVIENLYTKCRGDLIPPDNLEFHIAFGVPWMQIPRCAREKKVDLIVLGAHIGKADREVKAVAGKTVGSTAEGVIKHERCPVMIASKPIPETKVAFGRIMVSIDFSPSCISARVRLRDFILQKSTIRTRSFSYHPSMFSRG